MQNTGTIRAAFDAAVGLQGGYSDGPDKQRDNAGINGRTCTYQTPENAAKNTPINVNCCSQCSASTSVKRMMMLRDPVKHFSSQLAVYKSALNGADGTDTYLFSMVGEIPKLDTLKQLVRARRADAARLAATGTGAGAPERRPSAATFDSYGRLVPPPSAPAGPVVDATDQDIDVFSVASLHSSFGKLFDNPQTRFLLGFPYCAPGMQQAPPAYNSITAARPATAGWDRGAWQRRGVAAATGKDPWAKFRESVSDDQMRALIVAAVEDLFFVGITEEWDRSVLVLRNITGWGLRGYNKVLHTTDNGHPGTTKRVALTDKDVAAIRELNKWDEFVFRTATARLHRQAKMIGVVDSQATCKQSSQPKAFGQMLVACKFPELYMPGELAAEEQREEQLAKEAVRRAAVARGQRWSPKSQAEEERKRALAANSMWHANGQRQQYAQFVTANQLQLERHGKRAARLSQQAGASQYVDTAPEQGYYVDLPAKGDASDTKTTSKAQKKNNKKKKKKKKSPGPIAQYEYMDMQPESTAAGAGAGAGADGGVGQYEYMDALQLKRGNDAPGSPRYVTLTPTGLGPSLAPAPTPATDAADSHFGPRMSISRAPNATASASTRDAAEEESEYLEVLQAVHDVGAQDQHRGPQMSSRGLTRGASLYAGLVVLLSPPPFCSSSSLISGCSPQQA